MLVTYSTASAWSGESADCALTFHVVRVGRRGFLWTREDEQVFTIEALGAPFLTTPFERVYMSSENAVAPGKRFDCGLYAVEALAGDVEGGSRLLRFVFTEPFDEPRFRFLVWKDGRMTHVLPPRVGELRGRAR
jgi:hypothetical protein